MKKFLIFSVAALSLSAFSDPNIVYGEDNRVDVYESDNPLFVRLSESTAAMIPGQRLRKNLSGKIEILGRPLSHFGICEKDRFSEQTAASHCSGFLVGKNLIATAGHCITDQRSCEANKWVFNFKMENASSLDISVGENDVYSCKRIVSRSLESFNKNDYALIELDRDVVGKTPLKVRKRGWPSLGDEVVVIGHPSGLPTKIADGAKIRALKRKYFVANLDTYSGNSGSAVFNAKSGVVEGILVRGGNDFVYSELGCKRTNYVSDNGGRGEDVTYITNVPGMK